MTKARSRIVRSKTSAKIFISHASENRALALQLKNLIEKMLSLRVFCTSDIRALEGGKAWFNQIMIALRHARVCITVLTPESIHHRWVMFESGGAFSLAWGHEEILRMFPAIAGGLRDNNLPGPFNMIQARDLRQPSDVRYLCREVAQIFGKTMSSPPRGMIPNICLEAKKGAPHWSAVSTVLAGQRADESPFSIATLLPDAKKRVFCAGQTLNYLATSSAIRRRLANWVRRGAGRKVELLLCDPEDDNATDAWTVVGQNYRNDLIACVRTFQRWKTTLKKTGITGRIDIRVTKLVTTTLTAIDPHDDKKGIIILTPVVFGKPISGERPHFAIKRATNKVIFNHYWETYREVFRNARNIKSVSLARRV